MKKSKWAVALCAALLALGVLAGCSGDTDKDPVPEYVFTYAENQAADFPTAQAAYRFADLVYARTGGRIKINVYTNGQMGDEPSVLEQLHFGGIDFARVSVMTLGDEVPQMNVLQLPYLYEDSDHMWRVLDGDIGETFMNFLPDYGYVGLAWFDAGARNFYNSVRPITCLEDMADLKIRVAESSLMYSMVRKLGAKPQTISYSEVYSALETGQVDGAENNWPSYCSTLHYEIAPYVTTDAHNRIPEIQMCAQGTWNQLSEQDQSIILQCAKESAQYERVLWTRYERDALVKMEQAGCVIGELSPTEMERFRAAVEPLYEEFCGEYMDLVQAIQAQGSEQ